ncbi:hypothetical protein GCM10010359_61800 [Streptomyces morookaense]|nr:hypothetical protein GCM10010359_61800 [Streptomyces morookaense]
MSAAWRCWPPYGFMDWIKCVGKQSQDTALAGGVAGCVAGLETGCVAGAGVGGFGGALGGAVVGMKNCQCSRP